MDIKSIDKCLYEDIRYGTNIISDKEYLDTIITIADTAADMVVKTLGPYGKTTIIDDGSFTYPTKDGWSVLKRLRFNDPIFNTLYGVLKQVSFDLVNKVGDGTTSSFIGATIFMHKIIDYMEKNDFRQAEFLSELNTVVDEIVYEIENSKYVRKIDITGDFEDIYKIAHVASNGNEELSRMIQDIYKQTQNPNIYVEFDMGHKLISEIQKGYKLDCKPINQKGYKNSDDGTYKLNERSMVAIFDHNVNYNEHDKIISALSRYASAHRCSIFILAPSFDDILTNIIGTSINSMIQQGQVPNIMMVQVPLSMTAHRDYLSDVVLLTNAQVIDYGKVRAFNVMVHNQTATEEDKMEDALLNTDQYHFSEPTDIIDMCIGKVDKITVGEKYIVIQDYLNIVNRQMYDNVMTEVKEKFETLKEKANKSSSALQKEYMDAYQHYVKLYGNMGIIRVGGTSELEKHCLKDAVDDAVLACRSAFDHGYIRGLNLATMNVILDKLKRADNGTTEFTVLTMLFETFFDMSMNVLRNKYNDNDTREVHFENDDTFCKEMTNDDILTYAIENEYGFNLVSETFMKDSECTVINSTLTDIEIIRGIVSILSTMLTSNQFLSINRSFDRSMGTVQKKEERIQVQRDIARAVAEAVVDVIDDKSNKSGTFLAKIKSLFTK